MIFRNVGNIQSGLKYIFVFIFAFTMRCHSTDCDRMRSRIVRNIIDSKLLQVYNNMHVSVPDTCKFLPSLDMYFEQETQGKYREHPSKWACEVCGKWFVSEKFLDQHFDRRHSEGVYNDSDAVCLADFCHIFRCDVLQQLTTDAFYWEKALCDEEKMSAWRLTCQELVRNCLPSVVKQSVRDEVEEQIYSDICGLVTCENYWNTGNEGGVSGETIAFYVSITILLSVLFSFYYFFVYMQLYSEAEDTGPPKESHVMYPSHLSQRHGVVRYRNVNFNDDTDS